MSGSNLGQSTVETAAAAERIERAAQMQAQLSFLPTAAPAPEAEIDEPRGPGRPKGSKNRSSSELRRYLAAQGYRMPEQQLAQLGMLDAQGDVFIALMERAEQLIAWAGGSAGDRGRLGVFFELLKEAQKANAALLPFGLGKLTPDVAVQQNVSITMPAPLPVQPGDQAQIVNAPARRMAPPPMPNETQRNQELSQSVDARSDDESSDE